MAPAFPQRLIPTAVSIELINIGTELLLGRVLNSHQQWICRQLADRGHIVHRQIAIPDTADAISQAVREALARVPGVITTGGLGPTSDDLTRQEIARLFHRPLQQDPAVLDQIRSFFAQRNRPMPPSTAVQALVPQGAKLLSNECGTAPGLLFELNVNPFQPDGGFAWLVMLPGPPRELRPMFSRHVLPWLAERYPDIPAPACRTLRTVGIGESQVEQIIAPCLAPLTLAGLEIGYCARPGEVDVRLVARGPDATTQVDQAVGMVRDQIGDHVYGENDDELDAVVLRLLRDRRKTLGLAESCTGGYLAHRLTNIPGASSVFAGAVVTYSNEAKIEGLGVRSDTIAAHGAVSEPTAREMARGARDRFRTHYALAITGIAGPDGGTPEKPVGTAFVALATPRDILVNRCLYPLERPAFKQIVTQQALELLRRTLLQEA